MGVIVQQHQEQLSFSGNGNGANGYDNNLEHTSKLVTVELDSQALLEKLLCEFLAANNFNNLAVVQAWLHHISQIEENSSTSAAYESWEPESDEFLEVWGGTNCVGMVKLFELILQEHGFETVKSVTRSNNLPEGVSVLEVPFQHAALYARGPDGITYIVDPGLGLVKPIEVSHNSVEIADRTYSLEPFDDMQRLRVIKPGGEEIHFEFIEAPQDMGLEEGIQKPLLRATYVFKIDKFREDGTKMCSIKIDFMRQRVSYFVIGDSNTYHFSEIDQLEKDSLFRILRAELEDDELLQKIREVVEREDDIVDIWFEALQREYYMQNTGKLSPFETSWQELEEKGYEGGGVVIVLHDGAGKVMLYTVPEGREKPKINRFAGELNLFVETADHLSQEERVANLEDSATNLRRAFKEEIGFEAPEELIYREVDYGRPGSKIRARVFICQVDGSKIEDVIKHNQGSLEIGQVEWIDLGELGNLRIDQNARAILAKIEQEGIIKHE